MAEHSILCVGYESMKGLKERDEALKIISQVINNGATDITMMVACMGVPKNTVNKRISDANIILKANDAGKLVESPVLGIVLKGDEKQRGNAFDLIYKSEGIVIENISENLKYRCRRSNLIRHSIR